MIGLMVVYGLIMIGGGYLGYVKAQSRVSLIMGCASGVIVVISALVTKVNPFVGQVIFAVLAGVLTLVFGFRLFQTAKFMPSGVLFLLSAAAAGITAYQILALPK